LELKLEDKIDFNLEQYLTELENSIKKEVKEHFKLIVEATPVGGAGDVTEY